MVLFGLCMVYLMFMRRREADYSRSVKILVAGISAWLLWGVIISYGGFALFSSFSDYYEIIRFTAFIYTVVMASRIIILYDILPETVGLTAFVSGIILLIGYVTNFNGLEFLGSLSGIFQATGRYRVTFGFKHMNTTGRICLQFFIFMALYKALLQEKYSSSNHVHRRKKHKTFQWDRLYLFMVFMSPIVFVMLLSTASRASIACLILFWLVYFALTNYQKFRAYAKPLLFSTLLLVAALSFVLVDWGAIWEYFWRSRGINFVSTLPLLSEQDVWLTGMGFGFRGALMNMRTTALLDNFYLATLLRSGLIGFAIMMLTVIYFAILYFRETMYMTKTDRLIGGLLVTMLFYGMLENSMFGSGPFDFVNWLLLVTAVNERKHRAEIYTPSFPLRPKTA